MARRDDDEDRPRKRRPREEDEDRDQDGDADDEDEKPSRRRAREEDEENDRPRKTKKKKKKALPGILIAAAVISLVWGGLALLYNCYHFATYIHGLWELRRAEMQGVFFQMGGLTQGFYITLIASQFFMLVASLALIGGGIMLLLGKRIGRSLALGGSLGRIGVNVVGMVVGLIVSGGGFFALVLIGFLCGMVFDIAVSICLFIMLANDRAIKALQ